MVSAIIFSHGRTTVPRESSTAFAAASRRDSATITFSSETSTGSLFVIARTTGLVSSSRISSRVCSNTSLSGNLDTITMIFVRSSACSKRSASFIMIPPISRLRSRPPTPIALEIPPPYSLISVITSCIPVPDAPAIPISPALT